MCFFFLPRFRLFFIFYSQLQPKALNLFHYVSVYFHNSSCYSAVFQLLKMSIDIEKESENEECVSINTHIHTIKWCSESMFSIRISWYNRCIKSLLTVECRNKTKQRIDVKLKTNDERNKATGKKTNINSNVLNVYWANQSIRAIWRWT